MSRAARLVSLAIIAATAVSCTESNKTVPGSVKFILGGTAAGSAAPSTSSRAPTAVLAGDDYIVSPRQAKVTFTSVSFKDAGGNGLGEPVPLTNCTVTYDRTMGSGSTLLDCPFTVPVGDVAQMMLSYDKSIEILVSDATVGIYSNPSASTKFSTTAPAGGASYVPYTILIGDGSTRASNIVFSTPVTVAEGDTPSLYVTLDMVHTIQLKVNSDGATLAANPTSDPVVVFGGLSAGASRLFSGAATIEGYKVQGVPSLRVFYDNAGKPLYTMIGPNFCGADGGSKAAWATPPAENGMIGGWLGKDGSGNIAFALPTTGTFTTYLAYYVMADVSAIGQTTTLNCKVTSNPPPPADGKTYSSGAPTLTAPDKAVTLRLISK